MSLNYPIGVSDIDIDEHFGDINDEFDDYELEMAEDEYWDRRFEQERDAKLDPFEKYLWRD